MKSDTIRKELNPLSNCLNIADGIWEGEVPPLINVVQKAKPALRQMKKLIAGDKRDRRTSDEEIAKILSPAVKSLLMPKAYRFSLTTGMRRKELSQALAHEVWFTVKNKAGIVKLKTRAYLDALDYLKAHPDCTLTTQHHRSKKYLNRDERYLYLPAEITKTKKERYVYLVDQALEALEEMKPDDNGRIMPVAPHTMTSWLSRRCASCGIEDLRWHDNRHEATSRFAEMRWGIERIASSTGHEDWESLKRYLHVAGVHVERDPVTGEVV